MTPDPRPTTTDVYDREAPRYASVWGGFTAENLVRFARRASGAVLDAGCGTGRDLLALASMGLDPVGVDLSTGMLTQARSLTSAPLLRADMTALPFASDSFSGIWSAASLLHLPKSLAPAALRELARVSCPSAPLFCSVKLGTGESVAPDGRFFAYCQSEELAELLVRSGWRVGDLENEPDSRRPGTIWISAHATRS